MKRSKFTDPVRQAHGQAFNEMNPLLDITTAVTGLLC